MGPTGVGKSSANPRLYEHMPIRSTIRLQSSTNSKAFIDQLQPTVLPRSTPLNEMNPLISFCQLLHHSPHLVKMIFLSAIEDSESYAFHSWWYVFWEVRSMKPLRERFPDSEIGEDWRSYRLCPSFAQAPRWNIIRYVCDCRWRGYHIDELFVACQREKSNRSRIVERVG